MLNKQQLWPARIALFGCFCLLMVFTRSLFNGDTYWYVLDIKNSLSQGWTNDPHMWDFPHLLWRPFGKILAVQFLPRVLSPFHGNVSMSITFLLECVNGIAALVSGLVIQAAAWRLTGNRWAAALAAVSFLSISSILDYSRSGTSYLAGLAFMVMAIYLAVFYSSRSRAAAVWCGILSGFAVLVWVPYLVTLPAVLAAGPVLKIDPQLGEEKRYVRFAVVAGLTCGVIVAGFYAFALGCLHIHNFSALLQWIRETSHDPDRHKKLLRMATGFPRSVYELGDTARWIKWYLFKDPYAHVTLAELLRGSLLRLAVFYVTLAAFCLALLRHSMGRRLLVLTLIAMIPNIAMALTYESGSPERYLPFLPFVFIGFGYVLSDTGLAAGTRVFLALLCCAHIPVNLFALNAVTVNGKFNVAAESIAQLSQLRPGNRIYVINPFDERFQLIVAAPFHPVNQKPRPELNALVPIGVRIPYWRSDFASATLETWSHHGEVWMTNRVLSEQPERRWAWVEGDNPPMTWKAIHLYFQKFDHSEMKGGTDGFFLIRDTKENRRMLLAKDPPSVSPA